MRGWVLSCTVGGRLVALSRKGCGAGDCEQTAAYQNRALTTPPTHGVDEGSQICDEPQNKFDC